jgi:hypothetical protein
MRHEPAVGQRRATVPGDRELARSSPAIMVVDWIVKGGKMRGVKERGERRRRSYEGRKERNQTRETEGLCVYVSLPLAFCLVNSQKNKKLKITIEHRLISYFLSSSKGQDTVLR